VQEAAWYVRFGLWYCAKQAKAPGGVVRPFWPRDLARLTVRADVAELVDAHGSGPCGLRLVEVQVLSSASRTTPSASQRNGPRRRARNGLEPEAPVGEESLRRRRNPPRERSAIRAVRPALGADFDEER